MLVKTVLCLPKTRTVPHLGRRLEDVEADPALTIDVGVVDLGDEVD